MSFKNIFDHRLRFYMYVNYDQKNTKAQRFTVQKAGFWHEEITKLAQKPEK